jgi:hypothetical protein
MKNTLLLAALVPAALSLAGCGSFYAQAEQPEVCLTILPQTFTIPNPTIQTVGPFQGTFSGQVDLGISSALPDFLVDGLPENHILRFLSLEASITSDSSAANFNWLKNLSLTVSNDTTTKEVAFFGGGMTSGARVLKIGPLDANNNLQTFLQSGKVVFELEGSVDIPANAPIPTGFTVTVQGCFYAKVKKTFEEIINSAK